MKSKIFVILVLTVWTYSTRADGVSTYLYNVKFKLTDNKIIDAYFIDTSFSHPSEFKNENDLRQFLVQKTKGPSGKLEKLYKKLYRVLDYECVDAWIRGHIVTSKSEQLEIYEKDVISVKLIRRDWIPGQLIHDLTEQDIKLLIKEPLAMLSLKLEDDVQELGDIYMEYVLLSYSSDKSVDLKLIKRDIESEYFKESKDCNSNDKFRAWQSVFLKHKTNLRKKEILLLEIEEF